MLNLSKHFESTLLNTFENLCLHGLAVDEEEGLRNAGVCEVRQYQKRPTNYAKRPISMAKEASKCTNIPA